MAIFTSQYIIKSAAKNSNGHVTLYVADSTLAGSKIIVRVV